MNRNLILILVTLTLISCKKLDEFTQFNMPYSETVTIPSTSGIDLPFNLYTPESETNSESTFEINSTRKDLIEEIKIKKVELNIQSPDGEDFSFLESISVFLSADDLPEIKIAWNDNVSENTNDTLKLDLLDIDLQAYIKKDKFSLRLNAKTDEFLATDHEIEIITLFFVNAQIFKK